MLTTDLDANQDKDKAVLDKLLTTLIAELSVGSLSSEEFYNLTAVSQVLRKT